MERARSEGISFSDLVRRSLKKELTAKPKKKKPGQTGDPFFDDHTVYDDDGPEDLAANHDEYLYGGKQ